MALIRDGGLYYKKHNAYYVGGECPCCFQTFNIAAARPEHYKNFSREGGIRFNVLMCPVCAMKEFDQDTQDRIRDWCVKNVDILTEMNTRNERDTVSCTS